MPGTRRSNMGNGEVCPIDPEHGQMFVLASGQQWCPDVSHDRKREPSVYAKDGKTPVR